MNISAPHVPGIPGAAMHIHVPSPGDHHVPARTRAFISCYLMTRLYFLRRTYHYQHHPDCAFIT